MDATEGVSIVVKNRWNMFGGSQAPEQLGGKQVVLVMALATKNPFLSGFVNDCYQTDQT